MSPPAQRGVGTGPCATGRPGPAGARSKRDRTCDRQPPSPTRPGGLAADRRDRRAGPRGRELLAHGARGARGRAVPGDGGERLGPGRRLGRGRVAEPPCLGDGRGRAGGDRHRLARQRRGQLRAGDRCLGPGRRIFRRARRVHPRLRHRAGRRGDEGPRHARRHDQRRLRHQRRRAGDGLLDPDHLGQDRDPRLRHLGRRRRDARPRHARQRDVQRRLRRQRLGPGRGLFLPERRGRRLPCLPHHWAAS